MLRHLHAASGPVDAEDMVFSEERQAAGGSPWVMFNMVASVDGATAVEGGSSALNDEDDAALFAALRAVPDVILVGAGTVRAENYGPVTLDERRRARRVERGLDAVPRLAIATRTLSLEPDMRVFDDAERKPMLIVGDDVPGERLEEFSDRADIVQLPDLDAASIIACLGDPDVVLCEGGPSLNGQLIAAGFIDEMNLTLSPLVAVGQSDRIAHGDELHPPADMKLDRALGGDRALFLRYVRA